MSFKGFFKSCGKALLYFAVYFGWQLIVVNWASIAAAMYISSGDGAVGAAGDLQAAAEQLSAQVYELVMKYSLELTLIASVLTLITYFIIFKARKKNPFAEVGLTLLPPLRVFLLIMLGMNMNIFTSIVIGYIPFPQEWIDSYIESSGVITGSGFAVTLIVTAISAPIVEEITFRGLIYSRLKAGMPMFAAMLISSWVFGMVHGNLIWTIYTFVIGMLLVWVYEKLHSITAAITVHFAFNLTGLLLEHFDLGSFGRLELPMLIASLLVVITQLWNIQDKSKYKIEFFNKQEDEHE